MERKEGKTQGQTRKQTPREQPTEGQPPKGEVLCPNHVTL